MTAKIIAKVFNTKHDPNLLFLDRSVVHQVPPWQEGSEVLLLGQSQPTPFGKSEVKRSPFVLPFGTRAVGIL